MPRNTFIDFFPPDINSRDFTSPYVYKEYPKYVTLIDGSQLIVNDEEEELAATGNKEDFLSDNKEELLSKAKELGLKPHHKMNIDSLTKLINGVS